MGTPVYDTRHMFGSGPVPNRYGYQNDLYLYHPYLPQVGLWFWAV